MGVPVDGGPAFPSVTDVAKYDPVRDEWVRHMTNNVVPGMSLRAWFAGRAMEGLLASAPDRLEAPGWTAKWAVEHADALLQQLGLCDGRDRD